MVSVGAHSHPGVCGFILLLGDNRTRGVSGSTTIVSSGQRFSKESIPNLDFVFRIGDRGILPSFFPLWDGCPCSIVLISVDQRKSKQLTADRVSIATQFRTFQRESPPKSIPKSRQCCRESQLRLNLRRK